jgi:hypothetical protein
VHDGCRQSKAYENDTFPSTSGTLNWETRQAVRGFFGPEGLETAFKGGFSPYPGSNIIFEDSVEPLGMDSRETALSTGGAEVLLFEDVLGKALF